MRLEPSLPQPLHGLTRTSSSLVRTDTGWRLERAQVVHRPRPEVFAFFQAPENLEDITPGFLRFAIHTPRPVAMHAGARIEYRLSLFGWPIRWRTHIVSYMRGRSFVDEQESGPFAQWVHTHEFKDHPLGTLMIDRVDYRAPLGFLGRAAERLFVNRLVERIFEHRSRCIVDLVERAPERYNRAR